MFDSEIDVLEQAFCIISRRESIERGIMHKNVGGNQDYANLLWETMWNLYDILEKEKEKEEKKNVLYSGS